MSRVGDWVRISKSKTTFENVRILNVSVNSKPDHTSAGQNTGEFLE